MNIINKRFFTYFSFATGALLVVLAAFVFYDFRLDFSRISEKESDASKSSVSKSDAFKTNFQFDASKTNVSQTIAPSGSSKEISFPAILEFGRLPIQNGIAEKTLEFEIRNNTEEFLEILEIAPSCDCTRITFAQRSIAPKSAVSVRINVKLALDEIVGRKVYLLGKLKSKTGKELRLRSTLHASAGFSVLIAPSSLAFSGVHKGEKLQKTLEVKIPSEKPLENIVRAVVFKHPEFFSAKIENKPSKANTIVDTKETYYNNFSETAISFSPFGEEGQNSSELYLELFDGTKRALPIHWLLQQKPVFEPSENRYHLLAYRANETRDFPIIYNEDVGGKLRNIKTAGAGLSFLEKRHTGNAVHLKFRYHSSVAPTGGNSKFGEIQIESGDGKNHTLELHFGA